MSIFSSYKKIFLLGFILVILIAIPFSVYIAQKRQNITSKAAPSTTLSFEPASSPTAKVGDTVSLNIVLNPGTNQVSFAKLTIKFDASKFTATSLAKNEDGVNTLIYPIDPAKLDIPGTASISLSIGANPTKALATKATIAILQLKANAATTAPGSSVTFDTTSDHTQVLSIAIADGASENVLLPLSSAASATITVTGVATATSSPSPSPTSSSGPTCSNLNVDRSTTGTAPYSLTFTVTGNDSNGTISKVSLNFGDGPIQDLTTGGGIGTSTVTNAQISHIYNNAGTYTVYAILTDNSNNLSAQQGSCTKTITVNSGQAGGGNTGSGSETSAGTPTPIIVTQAPQPEPTTVVLPPTGPGEKIIGVGAMGVIFTIIGGALLIFL